MTTFLLNSPVLTNYGQWRFSGPLSAEDARRALAGAYASSIGHAGSAEFLSLLLGIEVPVQRNTVNMKQDDRAVVFRLLERLPEGTVLTKQELETIPYELGLLECLTTTP